MSSSSPGMSPPLLPTLTVLRRLHCSGDGNRYLAVLVLGFLTLDGSYEDELTSDGAIEQIQNFVLERHPNEVARNEEVVTNDQGIKWKFIRPFMRLTYSRHLPIQRLGAFALAALSRRRTIFCCYITFCLY